MDLITSNDDIDMTTEFDTTSFCGNADSLSGKKPIQTEDLESAVCSIPEDLPSNMHEKKI